MNKPKSIEIDLKKAHGILLVGMGLLSMFGGYVSHRQELLRKRKLKYSKRRSKANYNKLKGVPRPTKRNFKKAGNK